MQDHHRMVVFSWTTDTWYLIMGLKPHTDRHISLHVWSVYNLQETNASDWWLVPDFDKTNNTLYEAITSPFPLDELHKSHQQFAENPLPGLGSLCSRSPPINCFACLEIVPPPNQDTLVFLEPSCKQSWASHQI
jgi:hypothetical protein